MSPYILPEGNVAIAFSGGRTSAFMLHQILEANGGLPDRCRVVFANTGREMPETLDFVQECGERWGVKVHWVEYQKKDDKHDFTTVNHNSASRNGEPLFQLMEYFGFPPNRAARFCSHEGKTRTAKRFCVSLGWKNWTNAVGIRADESSRMVKHQPRDRYKVWYPLVHAGVSAREVAAFWERQDFDLQFQNIKGKAPLGNCDGCFLKSEANRAMLAREFPQRAKWWADMEKRFDGQFHATTSWLEIQKMVQRQGDWIFETEGALCQANDGECTG